MQYLPAINAIDVAVLIVIGANLIIGIRRGLSGELAGLIGTACAFGLGIYFLEPFGLWMEEHTRVSAKTAHAVAFASVAVGVILVVILLRLLLSKIMKITFEPAVDKFGGFISGLIRGCILVLIVFVTVEMSPHEYLNRKFGEESMFGRLVVKHVMPRIEKESALEDAKSKVDSAVEDLDSKIKKP